MADPIDKDMKDLPAGTTQRETYPDTLKDKPEAPDYAGRARAGSWPDPETERAQPGDVLGVERGGETTELGDTAEDEDRRRREAERKG